MKHALCASVMIATSIGLAPSLGAATLDFNDATQRFYLRTPYSEDGFTLTVLSGHYDIDSPDALPDGSCPPDYVCHHSPFLSVDDNFEGAGSRVRLTQSNGENFDLLSMYVFWASRDNDLYTAPVNMVSSSGGYSEFVFPATMTFSGPGWSNVAWIDFVAGPPVGLRFVSGVTLDDIVVAPSAVPLPASAWLLATAAGLVAPFLRRAP